MFPVSMETPKAESMDDISTAVAVRGATLAGAKAAAEPARRVRIATDFMVVVILFDHGQKFQIEFEKKIPVRSRVERYVAFV